LEKHVELTRNSLQFNELSAKIGLMQTKNCFGMPVLGLLLFWQSNVSHAECEVKGPEELCCTHQLSRCSEMVSTCELSDKKPGKLFRCTSPEAVAQVMEDCKKLGSGQSDIACSSTGEKSPAPEKKTLAKDLGTPEARDLLEKIKKYKRTDKMFEKDEPENGEPRRLFLNCNTSIDMKLGKKKIDMVFQGKASPRAMGLGDTINITAPSFVLKRVARNQFEYCEKKEGVLLNCHTPRKDENLYVPFVTTATGEILITTGGHMDIVMQQREKSKLHIEVARYAGEIRFNTSGEVTDWNAKSGTFKADEKDFEQAGLPPEKFARMYPRAN